MSAVDRLLSNYSRHVRLPWSANMSGKQRVWFAVYPPSEERRVRARLPQLEALTLALTTDGPPLTSHACSRNSWLHTNTGRRSFKIPSICGREVILKFVQPLS